MFDKKITELDTNACKLSDLDDVTAYMVLKRYLVDDGIYARKQEIDPSRKNKQYEFLPLHYMFVRVTDKMYNMIKTLVDKAPKFKIGANSDYICVSDIPPVFLMNNEFINQMDFNGPKSVYVSRKNIEEGFSHILEYHEAVIKRKAYPDERLSKISRGLGKYQNQIDRLSYLTKKAHLSKAIRVLVNVIKRIEN